MMPELVVQITDDAAGSLLAQSYLCHLRTGTDYSAKQGKRPALGIYNVSISRICRKISRCCEELENIMRNFNSVDAMSNQTLIKEGLVDYIELALYSAAEHVDDVESIAKCFFRNSKQFSKSSQAKSLKRKTKPIRDWLSSAANNLKHCQARIRICSMDFSHESTSMCLHGMYIESYVPDGIGAVQFSKDPDEVFISVTSFLWSIIIYIYQMSSTLVDFMDELSVVDKETLKDEKCKPLNDAVIALARLPTYTFDETHPFKRVNVSIHADEKTNSLISSGIYGSLLKPWKHGTQHAFGSFVIGYVGDGATKSFLVGNPKEVGITHWQVHSL